MLCNYSLWSHHFGRMVTCFTWWDKGTSNTLTSRNASCTKPPHWYLKCNINGSFLLCLRNEDGGFIVAKMLCSSSCEVFMMGTYWDYIRQCWRCWSLNVKNVIFELDAKFLVDPFHSSKTNLSMLGVALEYL